MKTKQGWFDLLKTNKFRIISIILFLIVIFLVIFTSVTFARYTLSSIVSNQSSVAKYKLKVVPYHSGNLIINSESGTDTIECGYMFCVQNYDGENKSEVSFSYSIFFILSDTIQSCLNSAELEILDGDYVATGESYPLSSVSSYSYNGVTYYSYTSSYSANAYAGNQESHKYNVKFVLNRSSISFEESEDTSFKKFAGFQVQAFANQII